MSKKKSKGKKEEAKIDYPENKRLKKLKQKSNKIYKAMVKASEDAKEAHTRFQKESLKLAEVFKEIEEEAMTPNFGDR